MPGIISRPSMYSRQATSVASSVMTRESSATGVSSTTSLSEIDDLEVEAPQHQTPEESAVVGFACRVPGAKSPDELWKNIVEQRDVQRKISKERFNVDAYYHPVGATKGTVCIEYRKMGKFQPLSKCRPTLVMATSLMTRTSRSSIPSSSRSRARKLSPWIPSRGCSSKSSTRPSKMVSILECCLKSRILTISSWDHFGRDQRN